MQEIKTEIIKDLYEKPSLTREGHLRDAAGTIATFK